MATKKEPKNLRIIRLESENVKRLRAVHITPKGDVVQITGANDNGKTSVLDSIWLALKQTLVDAPMPIRDGEAKARIRLDLGDSSGEVELIIERIFGKGAGLKVETPDGARMPAPQKILDALIGSLSFDPLAFTRMKPAEQYAALKDCIHLEVDIDKLEALNAGDFARRTELNRQAKAKRAEADAIQVHPAPDPAVDEREILDQIERAVDHNTRIERIKSARVAVQNRAAQRRAEAAAHQKRATDLRAEADALDQRAEAARTEATQLEADAGATENTPNPVNVQDLRAELERAQRTNRAHEERKRSIDRRTASEKDAEALEEQATALTDKMTARDAERAAAIQSAKMPVPGLGFGAGLVTYKGVPFQQASSAVQLRVSLGIAMAMNPRLRVIRIQDGSLLDDTSMEALADMAKELDFQIWIERVDMSGKVGIFIEDGAVKAVDGEPQR